MLLLCLFSDAHAVPGDLLRDVTVGEGEDAVELSLFPWEDADAVAADLDAMYSEADHVAGLDWPPDDDTDDAAEDDDAAAVQRLRDFHDMSAAYRTRPVSRRAMLRGAGLATFAAMSVKRKRSVSYETDRFLYL